MITSRKHLLYVTILTMVTFDYFYPISVRATPFTPLFWQQRVLSGPFEGQLKYVNWSADSNVNFIDDQLDALDPSDTANIIVDLNVCRRASEIKTEFSSFGEVQYISKFISFVALGNVAVSDILAIAARQDVAAVELQPRFKADIDVGARTIKARPSTTFTPNTAQDLGFTGKGVNIAILDTGVDNGHATFENRFVAGFNAFTDTEGDPDDDDTSGPFGSRFHGTHVAGIALGSGITGATCSGADDGSPDECVGVAPEAGLIDVKVIDANDNSGFPILTKGLEKVIEKQFEWGVGVVNMSLGFFVPGIGVEEGKDPFSQLVDTAVDRGLVVIASAGNNGPDNADLFTPASASRSITVAAANDQDTVGRVDDNIVNFSSRGPRADNGDDNRFDELKPEISAPGFRIFSAMGDSGDGSSNQFQRLSGTSMAAPHVAGVAALILEARPTINPGSIKELLKQTAETAPAIPGMETNGLADSPDDPNYDIGSGDGLIDAFAAVSAAAATDVKFPSCIDGNTPCLLSPDNTNPPSWLNTTDITLATDPPVTGVLNEIRVKVRNVGATNARGVKINVGVHGLTAGTSRFFELGSHVIDIAAGATVEIRQPWTPELGHRCIQATIDFALDSNFANNVTQRNVDVRMTSSPAVFAFDVENPLTTPVTVELKAITDNPNWTCSVDQPSFPLDPFTDCPRLVTATLTPVPPGSTVPPQPILNRQALLGGVSLRAVDQTSGTATCHIFAESKICDADADGKITRDDIRAILNSRNTGAQAGDPRDTNHDGKITVRDAKICISQCTNARCAL